MNPLLNPDYLLPFLIFVGTVSAIVWQITSWVKRSVKEALEPLETKVSNNVTRIDQLERRSDDKEVRIVRLEVTMENMAKVLERIENKIDRHFDN